MKINSILLKHVIYLFFPVIIASSFNVQAQMRVGRATGTLDGSAALDVNSGPYPGGSPYRGIIPPKVALSQTSVAAPVVAPATGLLVFNTATNMDVTPGYYYWESNQWKRFSTISVGSTRKAGDPIPAYNFSEAIALTTAPPLFMLTEPGQEGLFRYTPVDPPNPATGYVGDTLSANGSRDASGTILSSGTILLTAGGQRYKRVLSGGTINVLWFGASNNGGVDASQAIQRAVNYAKSFYAGNGGNYRMTVLLPEGSYLINKTIDLTSHSTSPFANAHGILLRGGGGSYLNTLINGATGGIIFDFTGSSLAGCENLSITSDAGWPNHSTIGVQFALGAYGGLNCSLRNCYFSLADDPAANNNMGSIGLVNCRSEEFAVTDCLIKANIGGVFSYQSDLSNLGYSKVISSPYATVAPGEGSMGVVNFSGQNSIQNLGKAQPALVLNGNNSFNFHGYLSRASTTGSGSSEAALLLGGPAIYNASINATIESFSQLMRVGGSLLNSTINCVVANQLSVGSTFPAGTSRPPVIDLSGGARLQGSKISVTFGNGQSEVGGRYLLYDGGGVAAYNQLLNSEIVCSQWVDNTLIASANLLTNTDNTSFKVALPFEKKSVALSNTLVNSQNFSTSGWTTGTYNQIVANGVLTPGKLYVMKIIWGQNGVDQIVQSYIFPVSGTDYSANEPATPVLTPNTVTYSNAGRTINIRYRAPTVSGSTSYGLEAAINKPDMNGGTLTVSIVPFL